MGKPEVIMKEIDGVLHEPVEQVEVEVADEHTGTVMGDLGRRKGLMENMSQDESGASNLTYKVPTRGLLGFRSLFLTSTRGTGILHTIFAGYEPYMGEMETREVGSLVNMEMGSSTNYSLEPAQIARRVVRRSRRRYL